jgi:hypothetical protein
MIDTDFNEADVATVVQMISFPSALDYVRFQRLATAMAALSGDRSEVERQEFIKAIAAETEGASNPAMLQGGSSRPAGT